MGKFSLRNYLVNLLVAEALFEKKSSSSARLRVISALQYARAVFAKVPPSQSDSNLHHSSRNLIQACCDFFKVAPRPADFSIAAFRLFL